ncbi:shikimate 5-dehydrogenase [Corynebacterium poyangense]|uniref:Shikimate 5-dehydrogenase n=1 Tax=Corynebacterium poyangense TaxID=2684405 RepID=A0A7H0SN95_9CORY|nr:shikimate 5-dehydrogenase [Corynebacterium poyangense]MBZ8177042.1 shikimate 5-dehydrogenase [Corynebacterium poyangense]QNQ90020.1 shikimate 5-dehydrogenase [Corynebacterium poyangense]
MTQHIDRDTKLCISLAARPSNHGVRFHNWLYRELGLNYLYKAFAPEDITAAVAGIRGLGIRGAGVSMPYKQEVIPLLDDLDDSAARINAVNTIVNDDGFLRGYNTDFIAVRQLLLEHQVDPGLTTAVRGSGGMAHAVVAALAQHGMQGTIVARNHNTGSCLAHKYGWDYSTVVPEATELLVNVTPLGMRGEESDLHSFSEEDINRATIVFDVVADPVHTPLIHTALALNKHVITGGEVISRQAAEQFRLYTGVELSPEHIQAAEEFASTGL